MRCFTEVVSGVEVMPYVEAELDRRHPGPDRSGRPGLDEVLTVRERQASEVEAWLARPESG